MDISKDEFRSEVKRWRQKTSGMDGNVMPKTLVETLDHDNPPPPSGSLCCCDNIVDVSSELQQCTMTDIDEVNRAEFARKPPVFTIVYPIYCCGLPKTLEMSKTNNKLLHFQSHLFIKTFRGNSWKWQF